MMQLEHQLGTRCKNVVKHGILHVTIEDLTFPKISWLLKGYNEDTRNRNQKYFDKKLCSGRIVTENEYSLLKGRFS